MAVLKSSNDPAGSPHIRRTHARLRIASSKLGLRVTALSAATNPASKSRLKYAATCPPVLSATASFGPSRTASFASRIASARSEAERSTRRLARNSINKTRLCRVPQQSRGLPPLPDRAARLLPKLIRCAAIVDRGQRTQIQIVAGQAVSGLSCGAIYLGVLNSSAQWRSPRLP